jgi:hypothetical protein
MANKDTKKYAQVWVSVKPYTASTSFSQLVKGAEYMLHQVVLLAP